MPSPSAVHAVARGVGGRILSGASTLSGVATGTMAMRLDGSSSQAAERARRAARVPPSLSGTAHTSHACASQCSTSDSTKTRVASRAAPTRASVSSTATPSNRLTGAVRAPATPASAPTQLPRRQHPVCACAVQTSPMAGSGSWRCSSDATSWHWWAAGATRATRRTRSWCGMTTRTAVLVRCVATPSHACPRPPRVEPTSAHGSSSSGTRHAAPPLTWSAGELSFRSEVKAVRMSRERVVVVPWLGLGLALGLGLG